MAKEYMGEYSKMARIGQNSRLANEKKKKNGSIFPMIVRTVVQKTLTHVVRPPLAVVASAENNGSLEGTGS